MFTIYRECIFYINLRHAYLMSPYQARRLSSRTVLFLCMPDRYLDEHRLRKVFGDGVKNVWIPRDVENLERLVKERDQTALRLERAEIRLIKMANRRREKELKAAREEATGSESTSPRGSSDGSTGKSRTTAQDDVEKATPRPSLQAGRGTQSSSLDIEQAASSSNGDTDEGILSSFDAEKITPSTSVDPEKDVPPTDDVDPDNSSDQHPDAPAGLPDVNGSVAAQWIRASERPHHRPVANFFRRVDTIKWTRKRLKILAPRIRKLKRNVWAGQGKPLPAAFVEFTTQAEAEAAYQTQAHHRPMRMAPRFIGARPDELIWNVLGMQWAERIVRRFAMFGVITVGIIFWSFPSALVGALSNISFLADSIPFLGWIMKLPEIIIGILQGFVPALALSLLMAIVPWLLRGILPQPWSIPRRCTNTPRLRAGRRRPDSIPRRALCAKRLLCFSSRAGLHRHDPYVGRVWCHHRRAAGPALGQGPARRQLAQVVQLLHRLHTHPESRRRRERAGAPRRHLPTLRDCEADGEPAGHVQRVAPREGGALGRHLPGVYKHGGDRWVDPFRCLRAYTDGELAISYSCIAPLILGFATAGIYVIYLVYRYNLLYIHNTSIDTRGLVYPRALMQLLVGLYLAEICMIGLFALRDAFGPMLLMILFLVLSALVHLSIQDAISPLLYNLPRTLSLESDELERGGSFEIGQDDAIRPGMGVGVSAAAEATEEDDLEEGKDEHVVTGTRGLEGADGFVVSVKDVAKDNIRAKMTATAEKLGLMPIYDRVLFWLHPPRTANPNAVLRFLHPAVFEDFAALQKLLPPDAPDPTETYPADYARRAYWPPVMTTEMETLWVPRDEAGVSAQEVRHSKEATGITDEGAWLEGDGGVRIDVEVAPWWQENVRY